MSKKNHSTGPVPAGNRPQSGTAFRPQDDDVPGAVADQGEGFQEEDPKRRLGDFTGTGEHARQQPGPKNDGGTRHGEDAG
ncbi:hypothetical protein GobsT_02570 [Gemmata obscuriglobus]|uniref:Uncharacterized protein n=1 Tax=Gemmata obscuriglobus TaxID=114 RepID=A0A2Z3HDU8_9BACT|nr:hypothetical protein [Gemmata obscuriglobus]AWM41135.1 hypothetical protein C1280_31870 [Gemmata obscuriglobus]QEG25530.1 hypothetical protein GobsT_02570 [Gemmata obscuriglobus]VTR98859.1 unnamed protein product [Gemmata obscuriglobus UQM 2246]